VLVAIRLVYVSPFAITQDVVAARQVLKGEPLPTTEIEPLVREALASEPRPATLESVWPWLAAVSPGLPRQEKEEYDLIPSTIQVQAHPPFASLFVIPLVYFLGVYDSSIGLGLLSLACLSAILVMLYRGLELTLSASQKVLFCCVFLGWFPMYGVLRSGQWGAVLSMLVVAGWYNIRSQRPILGGVTIGVAVSLKLFPGLLLIYLLLRHRRACLAGVATAIIMNVATMAIVGLQAYIDYVHTGRTVVDTWAAFPQNWSLLGALHHFGDMLGTPALSSRVVVVAIALLLVTLACISALSVRPSRARIDVEYALFVVVMTFLSPVCWSHYFVVLLLPVTVLASHAMRGSASSSLMFLGLFLVLALPDPYAKVAFPFLEPNLGPRAGMALVLLPPLAILVMILWLATLAWTSSGAHDDSKPTLLARGLA
jgi:hypothetical protein